MIAIRGLPKEIRSKLETIGGDCARRTFPFGGGFNAIGPLRVLVLRAIRPASSEQETVGGDCARRAIPFGGGFKANGPLRVPVLRTTRPTSSEQEFTGGDCARRAIPFGGGFKANGPLRVPVLRTTRPTSSELGRPSSTQNARFRGRLHWQRGGDSNPRYSLTRTAV